MPKGEYPRGPMKGTIDRDGYRYFLFHRKGEPVRRVAEQRLMWEQAYGPIPDGMDVHHRDENKLNNVLENFELIPKSEHQRMHQRARWSYVLIDEIWHKACRECFEVLPLDAFYDKPSGKSGGKSKHCWCKNCYNEKVIARRNRRVET